MELLFDLGLAFRWEWGERELDGWSGEEFVGGEVGVDDDEDLEKCGTSDGGGEEIGSGKDGEDGDLGEDDEGEGSGGGEEEASDSKLEGVTTCPLLVPFPSCVVTPKQFLGVGVAVSELSELLPDSTESDLFSS